MVELVGGGNDRKKVGNHCAITMNRDTKTTQSLPWVVYARVITQKEC